MSEIEAAREQEITPFDRFSDAEVAARPCVGGMPPSAKDLAELQAQPDWPAFVDAVKAFQDVAVLAKYRVMFFFNLVPPVCPDGDYFYDGKWIETEYFVGLFSAEESRRCRPIRPFFRSGRRRCLAPRLTPSATRTS